MKLFTYCTALVFLCITASLAHGQTSGGFTTLSQSVFPPTTPNPLPPSPDAFSFTKFGNLPIGLSTGTAQFSIPLYTIKSGGLSHALSLSYSSNGVKVDAMASRVGIDWNLRAGGVITRTVMDLPDGGASVQPTYYHGGIAYGDSSSTGTQNDFYTYIRQASYAGRPDFQPDEYSFSMDGYSGKFLKRENGDYTQYNSSGMKIEAIYGGFLLTAPNGTKYYFDKTETPYNYSNQVSSTIEYVPAPVPTAWYLTKIIAVNRDSIVFHYGDTSITFLNGISQVFQTNTLEGTYLNVNDNNSGSFTGLALPTLGNARNVPSGIETNAQLTDNNPAYITSIDFAGGHADFKYSTRDDVLGEKKLDSVKVYRSSDGKLVKCWNLQYIYSQANSTDYDTYILTDNITYENPSLKKRLFLSGVNEWSNGQAYTQSYHFDYDSVNALPPRLSFSQDRYGSFNGVVNEFFFPNDTWYDQMIGLQHYGGDRNYRFRYAKLGMLKKITYPTGGSTSFEYEPNKTTEDYAYHLNRDSISVAVDTSTTINEDFYSDTIHHDGSRALVFKGYCDWASVPMPMTDGMGHDIDFEDQYYLTICIQDVSTGSCFSTSTVMVGNSFYNGNFFGVNLPTGVYRLKVTASRAHLQGRVSIVREWRTSDRSDSSGIAGVRVKMIVDSSGTGVESNRRRYIYGSWDDSTSSSGTGLNLDPNKMGELGMVRLISTYLSQNYMTGYNTIQSNSIYSNYTSELNAVVYTKVIELNSATHDGNMGGTEYQFMFRQKAPPLPIVYSWGQKVWNPMPVVSAGAPSCNNDFETGTMSAKISFTYTKPFGTRTILQSVNNYYSVDTAHMLVDTFTVSKNIIKSPDEIPSWDYFSHYEIWRYRRYYGFFRLDSTVETNYAASNQLKNRVVYGAYSGVNYQPTYILFYSSREQEKSLQRIYVPNVSTSDPNYSTAYSQMIDAHQIDGLVDESAYQNVTALTRKHMDYAYFSDPDLRMPNKAYSSLRGNTLRLDMTFEKYDAKGNLLQFTGRDGVVNSILYGYNGMYPVAQIKGASYTDAIAQVSTSVLNNPSSDGALRAQINGLRSYFGNSAQITSATYSPLIGVTSQTDVAGRNTYFEYDDFNRLYVVRDKDSNIIKKYCYKYADQPGDCDGVKVFESKPIARTFYKNNCTSPLVGTGVVYTIPLGKYTSTVSQDAADALAEAEVSSYAQSNANTYGSCVTNTCTGNDKKIINGVCETGTKVCTSSVRQGGATWLTTYHYEWSDNSVSEDYTELGAGCFVLE